MDIKILSEEPISMFELKKEIKKIGEKDKELNFRANKTNEYLNQFISLDAKQQESLIKKLNSLKIPRLKPEHVVKILDVLPKKVDELKVLLQQFTVTISNDNMKKIIEAIKSIVPDKKKKEKK